MNCRNTKSRLQYETAQCVPTSGSPARFWSSRLNLTQTAAEAPKLHQLSSQIDWISPHCHSNTDTFLHLSQKKGLAYYFYLITSPSKENLLQVLAGEAADFFHLNYSSLSLYLRQDPRLLPLQLWLQSSEHHQHPSTRHLLSRGQEGNTEKQAVC